MPKIHNVEVVVGADFQNFDHGGEVTVFLPEWYDEDVRVGDSIYWVCGQFDGTAKVITTEGRRLVVKK